MKRFMVFVGECFYPNPGMKDFKEDFSDPFEAIRCGQKLFFEREYQWFQVYDLERKTILLDEWYSEYSFGEKKERYLKEFSQETV